MISAENLVRIYKTAEFEVIALQGLDLEVADGELMAIIGNSGSGKTTLLNVIGGLDLPSAGRITVADRDLLKLSRLELLRYRREKVGFVWQSSARNLIPYLSAVQNVEVPMLLTGRGERRRRAQELLAMVGMAQRAHNRPSQLSGGEQQRVAIAIALANAPPLVLADEPTGSVDGATASTVLDVLRKINQELGVTVVIVTHDRRIAQQVDRVVAIRDGRTSSEFIRRGTYASEISGIAQLAAHMEEADTHQELAVVDRAGRLQVPGDYLRALGVDGRDRLQVELEDDRIVLRRPTEETDE
ncbi:MAG: ABC transporter ATP-binding protein [Spirochaetaceae bacterium]|nr:ABC transporter ATP-binding protein [Spirochaetaceae bacterium]MDE0228344.1 ABC transporter ATP-binding protein [Spirochaetaceae bacterium]